MKTCSKCGADKSIDRFYARTKSSDGRQGVCKPCMTESKRDSIRKTNNRQRSVASAYVDSIKRSPCMDCGIFYPPYVMQFDHRDPSTKIAPVSTLIGGGMSQRLITEIAKCDLVCANCHCVRTYQRRMACLSEAS
jgi:hypothetical protein